MSLSQQTRNDIAVELEIRKRSGEVFDCTAIGFVNERGLLEKTIRRVDGVWEDTDAEPVMYLATKLERVVKSTKRFIAIIGGRGSTKSVAIAGICIADAKDNDTKTFCLREYQSSIKNSVHSLLKSEIGRLEFTGFDVQAQSILRKGEDVFQFAGIARNVDNVKSSHGFKRYYVEEAQFLSQDSLDVLTPTARNKPNKGLPKTTTELADDDYSGVSMVFVANPESSEDPFSQRFIVPFQEELDRDGYYEDDLHLIVVMNYHDNPWFAESGLEQERKWAKVHMSTAMYEHIWLGAYNDSVEDSLIERDWFDACVDAHTKQGWEARGANIVAHDPSDTGRDSKGYAMRHGSVVKIVTEKIDGDVNEGSRWAVGMAMQHKASDYTWDCDGMGVALNEQVVRDFKDKPVRVSMFRGSESPDQPDALYKPALAGELMGQKTNKEVFRNKRAQYYSALRDRCYKTYRSVVHGEYADPEKMISFDSKTIDAVMIRKLRSELCRMPVKPNRNGLIELYTKDEMFTKFKFTSPNLGDAVMMLMRFTTINVVKPYVPKRITTMGRR